MKSMVVISKNWHKPEIELKACREGISVSMNLVDFLDIVFKDAGSVTWQFSNEKFRAKIDATAEKIFDSMKAETTRII